MQKVCVWETWDMMCKCGLCPSESEEIICINSKIAWESVFERRVSVFVSMSMCVREKLCIKLYLGEEKRICVCIRGNKYAYKKCVFWYIK